MFLMAVTILCVPTKKNCVDQKECIQTRQKEVYIINMFQSSYQKTATLSAG